MGFNKILAVDDSSTMLRILVNALNALGYANVTTSEDGKVAWEKIVTEKNFDLIISDWNMPQMLGIELLKAVRSDDATKNIPFIMLTSRNVKEDILAAIKGGANDYLVKPFTKELLKEKLDRLQGNSI